ncbi:MAG: nuclear transport factor 2 family protein, partial [Haloarculaceae archaeon]
ETVGDSDARETVEAYYDALRAGEPLGPFFADGEDVVKVGISERLVGSEAVVAGLREQTGRTRDWAVESTDLRVTEREAHAWFADLVSLGWTDTERRVRYEFETRWSGTLERREKNEADDTLEPAADGPWRFVGMHVSTAGEL